MTHNANFAKKASIPFCPTKLDCVTVIAGVQLTDRYTIERGTVYLTGIQAIVRLPLDQMRRDRRAGLRTAGYISGYEGSPLGGYDMALRRAGALLEEFGVH